MRETCKLEFRNRFLCLLVCLLQLLPFLYSTQESSQLAVNATLLSNCAGLLPMLGIASLGKAGAFKSFFKSLNFLLAECQVYQKDVYALGTIMEMLLFIRRSCVLL